jgi:hypothetical protein
MVEPTTGREVREQAQDNSFLNTEPAIARGAVIAAVGAIGTVLVVLGVLDESQKEALAENAGTIVVAILAILPIVQALWTRISVYSPRSAARIAVESAAVGVPSMVPPP